MCARSVREREDAIELVHPMEPREQASDLTTPRRVLPCWAWATDAAPGASVPRIAVCGGAGCTGGVLCGSIGLLCFLCFYLLMVAPEQDMMDRTKSESCRVTMLDVQEYRCSQRSQCSCGGCTSGGNGWSCGGGCCIRTCCKSCQKSRRSCTSSGSSDDNRKSSQSCTTEYYTDACCTSPCCESGKTSCLVSWSSCWNFYAHFERQVAPEKEYPPESKHCGYADHACAAAVQQQFAQGTALTCWYDPKHDAVAFEAPDDGKLIGGWVGAGFGIVFMSIGVFASLVALAALLAWAAPKAARLRVVELLTDVEESNAENQMHMDLDEVTFAENPSVMLARESGATPPTAVAIAWAPEETAEAAALRRNAPYAKGVQI